MTRALHEMRFFNYNINVRSRLCTYKREEIALPLKLSSRVQMTQIKASIDHRTVMYNDVCTAKTIYNVLQHTNCQSSILPALVSTLVLVRLDV